MKNQNQVGIYDNLNYILFIFCSLISFSYSWYESQFKIQIESLSIEYFNLNFKLVTDNFDLMIDIIMIPTIVNLVN